MNILALDTSSDACSAAVLCGENGETCFTEFTVEPRAHTRLILPMVESVLQQAGLTLQDMDALTFGRGPGAFTGVRIATGVVQGLALAAGKPVIPVSTLAAIAQQAYQQQQAEKVLVAVDARMGEVYWGQYQLAGTVMQLQGGELVLAPADAPLPGSAESAGSDWLAAGSGWREYAQVLQPRFADYVSAYQADWLPAAEYIARLALDGWKRGEAVDAELAQPVYLRNKVAQTIRERAAR
ncbi:MAG: tRNA (adenosine(37)-N6)-threonylcarbamoyltransferase complex dimerization subunit type 1 TsaB [Thiolinea sp.]